MRWALGVLVGCGGPEIPPAPPVVPLQVTVAARTGIHDLVATVAWPDGEQPRDVRWAWARDGARVENVTDRVPATDTRPGEIWTATATAIVGLPAAAIGSVSHVVPAPPGGNVIVIVIDDVGLDKLAIYGAESAALTPTIDALAARGVLFRNAYASPTCTPTRANLLTGRHASRSGAGAIIDLSDTEFELSLDALTVPEALADARSGPWSNSSVGKWHLSSRISASAHAHPGLSGFDWYGGSLGYLLKGEDVPGEVYGYFRWDKTDTDGNVALRDAYNTTDTVDDALARIAVMEPPFFLWLALNAPHTPLHVPPAGLHTRPAVAESTDPELFDAMLEAADTELGRLFASMDPAVLADTTVIFIADNGTSEVTVAPPSDPARVKGTVFEGGVHVPLLVAGPLVAGPGETDALVHAVDVFATIAEIAGIPLLDDGAGQAVAAGGVVRRIDGISLLPWMADPSAPSGREFVLAENLSANGDPPWDSAARTIRDARWKLIRRPDGDALFELVPGVLDEGPDLLPAATDEQLAAYDRLSAALDAQVADMPYEGF